jgi:hypothetical protein
MLSDAFILPIENNEGESPESQNNAKFRAINIDLTFTRPFCLVQ